MTLMLSVKELIQQVVALKHSSEELSEMLAYAGSNLRDNANALSQLMEGSGQGEMAAQSVGVASQSLLQAAASIKTLSRTCDNCAKQLAQ